MATKRPRKVPKKEQLFERILAIDAERTAAVKRLERELAKLYGSYFARVKALVATDPVLRKTDAMNLQATTKMVGELTGILREAGFTDVVRLYGSQFEPLAEVAAAYYEPFGLEPSLAGVSKEDLQAYVRFAETEFGYAVNRSTIAPVQSALFQANLGSLARDQVIDQVLSLEPRLTPVQATVFVDDSFAQFQRTVVTQKGDNLGMDIFQYLGPNDEITSPQCREMLTIDRHGVPGMLYKDEITTDLHPKLTRNPLVGGGHPRCRHQWNPVTEEYAVSLGFRPRN